MGAAPDRGAGRGRDRLAATAGPAADDAGAGSASVAGVVAIPDCVCHIVCEVLSMSEAAGHWLVHAQMLEAFVRAAYWDGKNFVAQGDAPPYFTFLGSTNFGYVVREPPAPAAPPSGLAQQWETDREEPSANAVDAKPETSVGQCDGVRRGTGTEAVE